MNTRRAIASVFGAFLALIACPSPIMGSAEATFVLTVSDEATNGPVVGARVTLTSASGTYTAVSDSAGRVSIEVPPDTYTASISVPGFETETFSGLVLTAGATQSFTARVHPLSQAVPTPAPPPPPPPPTSPPATPVPQSTPGLVHDSVLSVFNEDHPEHVAGEPYFGRYSYVLLHDGDESVQKRNRSLVGILVDRFVATGSTIRPGAPGDVENPWGYNVFFLPVRAGFGSELVSTKSAAADRLMSQYDYAKAHALRDQYCAAASHLLYSACLPPDDSGPVVLTFLAPLPRVLGADRYPPALAYDFSGVDPGQFGRAVDTISRKIVVPASIEADRVLPPTFVMRYLAPLLNSIADALAASIDGVRVFLDKSLKLPH
jgi:carboxypeptidase family protein